MSFNDPIAELLTRLRNAKKAKHRFVDIALSKARVQILSILKDKGFIENFLASDEKKKIRIFLRYNKDRRSVLRTLKRVSKPGRRRYCGYKDLRPVFGNMGISILSTSKGILEGNEAKKQKVGGELLCYIW